MLRPMAETASGRSCGACCTKLVDFGVRLGRTPVLEGVNLHMHCGELTALIGPNGAGKTTLLRAMLGELPHTGGLQFLPVGRAPDKPPRIGYVPQKLDVDALSPVTVQDVFSAAVSRWPLWLGHRRRGREETLRALLRVGAQDLAERRLGELSVGQLQRVLLALALTPVPDILLLDEPVAGIDQAGIGLFYEMISELRKKYDLAILLISHDLEAVARVADRMVFLNRTVQCDGEPRDVLSRDVVRRTFGVDVSGREIAAAHEARSWHDRAAGGGR
jgi:zinc transport system ATP-binding protein